LEFVRGLKSRYMALHASKGGDLCVMATGGGAYKYYDRMREVLDVEVIREDEMECLIIGTTRRGAPLVWAGAVGRVGWSG
jgi:type II pantothenate kinase